MCEATARGHVGFAADDGFDAGILGFAVELDGPEHVAMVGHGHGRLIERFDLLDERLDLIRAVQETVLGMEVEMDEWTMPWQDSRRPGKAKSNARRGAIRPQEHNMPAPLPG